MKIVRSLLSLGLMFFCCLQVAAQGPTLNLVGGSPSFAKGTIDMETLSRVIQKKQEEIKQLVFRNTVIKEFRNSTYQTHLNNYTTFSYVYNLMDVMTSGKNKTVITKSIIQNATEFAYVYGMVIFIQQSYETNKLAPRSMGNLKLTVGPNVIKDAIVTAKTDNNGEVLTSAEEQYSVIPKKIKDFNFLMDLVYDILMNDDKLHPGFKFSADVEDESYVTWLNADNVYRQVYNQANSEEKQSLDALRAEITTRIGELVSFVEESRLLFKQLEALAKSGSPGSKAKVEDFLKEVWQLDATKFSSALEVLINDGTLTADLSEIKLLIGRLKTTTDKTIPLLQFYANLKKSDYKDFTLTKDQYYALKFITIDFLKVAKNQFKNDVVATVINFMLENTLLEYAEGGQNIQTTEKDATSSDRGYLYIDIEAVISAVSQHFKPSDKKGKYVQLFFSIGTNQASFLHTNALTVNEQNLPKSLGNLYYATEKLGLKWKIWNEKYRRSFVPGETYTYYSSTLNSWKRPQPKPAISDVHLMVYGAGLLYNLVNLKSNDNFNYAIAGTGLGITFFNGLALNVGIACPYTDKRFNSRNMFVNFGIDIPIIDYLSALTK